MVGNRLLVLACVAALTLGGCSGTTDDTAEPTQTGSTAAPATSAAAVSGVSATALCAYLSGELPKLKAVGSKVGAMAQLAVGLANFFEENGKPANGSEMDELTIKECPAVRTEVLTTIGVNTFAEL